MLKFKGKEPQLDESVFVAPGAHVSGAVSIGRDSSVFYNSVARGDVNTITIGERTNIQDNCTLHVTEKTSLTVGDDVTVGHNVILHGCRVGNQVMVGMGAIVLDGAEIGDNCIVAAGSLVPPNKSYPAGLMIMGSPARVVRKLSEEEQQNMVRVAAGYVAVQNAHKAELKREQAERDQS